MIIQTKIPSRAKVLTEYPNIKRKQRDYVTVFNPIIHTQEDEKRLNNKVRKT